MNKLSAVTFEQVDIHHGFWHDRQELNRHTTIYNVYKRFKETGRFDAFRCDWKEGMPNRPHYFWDSDIAKWIESVAYIIEKNPDPVLEQIVDEVVDRIEKNQDQNGYFNIYFTVCEPDQRFTRRTDHELYCAGHLIEAAVAYAHATGKEKFLHLMCRFADHIEEVFKTHHSTAFYTCGHEEIELALVKLFRYTGEKRYLELSKWFVEERGRHEEDTSYDWANRRYQQDHVPVRDMDTAEGHAVRALYLYAAMADLAYEYDDTLLLEACRKILGNITEQRMYITGGIGSTRCGEAFTVDYHLPNLTAYTESCAAISLILFCQRMLMCETNSLYADIVEKVLYNGFLSSTSLDGKKYFYENPLEIVPSMRSIHSSTNDAPALAISQRVEVFDCSCCPPNITRLIASLGSFLYTHSEDTLYIHQYIDSKATLTVGGQACTVVQSTTYPHNGKITLSVSGLQGKNLAVRIPGWCKKATLTANGTPVSYTLENGYAVITVLPDPYLLELDFDMPVTAMEASPLVRDDAGKIAIQRGPVIYCAEAVDNGDNLWALEINAANLQPRVEESDQWINTVVVNGRRQTAHDKSLYHPVDHQAYTPQEIRLIPYYAFANRGESEMAVWLRKYED